MTIASIETWIAHNPWIALPAAVVALLLIYLITRLVLGRGLTYVAGRTKNQYDDIVVKRLRPNRASWLAPFIILYAFTYLAPQPDQAILHKTALFFILWLSSLTINGLISAFNEIYESRPGFNGVSIQGYLDIVKILVLLVSVILSISLITSESPLLLLSGLGALTAVLLLIFHDTIMSLIASIQISTHDLVKEGDWLEVPSYDADGEVINLDLHTIKIRNWDMTNSVIPTYKVMDAAFKNWRGMQESGGRRIKRSINIDQTTVKFCSPVALARYRKIDLIHDYLVRQQKKILAYETKMKRKNNSPLDGPQITNIEVFRAYTEAYLKRHPDIHHEKMAFLVRELAPTPSGLPLEVYVFTKTTQWNEYERIQAEIFDHLLAAAAFFDLRVFQEPAGSDFARALRT